VHASTTSSSTSKTAAAASAGLIAATAEEERTGQQQLTPRPTAAAASRRAPAQDFVRPAAPAQAPAPDPPRLQTARETTNRPAEESMGKLASASRSSRPALISQQQQQQLATPVSTTTPSSLTQGYATFLRANNNGACMHDMALLS
jgi:bloom syndrome protein